MNVKLKYGKVIHTIKRQRQTPQLYTVGDTGCDRQFSTNYGDTLTKTKPTCRRCKEKA